MWEYGTFTYSNFWPMKPPTSTSFTMKQISGLKPWGNRRKCSYLTEWHEKLLYCCAALLISQIKPISELAYYIWNGILMSFNHCTWVILIWWRQCLQCLLGKAIKVVCNYDFAHTVLLHMQQERKYSKSYKDLY